MAVKYTEAMISELKALPRLDYNTATVFADKHGIAVRSVIAKVRALELDYHAKSPSDKSTAKAKGPSKADIVNDIEAALGVKLPSLAKMTVADLVELQKAVG